MSLKNGMDLPEKASLFYRDSYLSFLLKVNV
jgi:hypothetical protein